MRTVLLKDARVVGTGTTGSGRQLAAVVTGADLVRNEITAHAVAAPHFVHHARTVIDIGGQDSKLILLENGVVVDFAIGSVCAAGTESFLEQQAHSLNIPSRGTWPTCPQLTSSGAHRRPLHKFIAVERTRDAKSANDKK